jgi:RNA polymerase sigma-70 factor (ECF subfamily)
MPTNDREKELASQRFEALWSAHYADVFAFALRRLGDPQSADEVCADAFLVAWRRLDAIPDSPRPWLLAVARKVLANHRRSQRRRQGLLARMTASTDVAAATEPARSPDDPGVSAAVEAFNALSAADREVLSLVIWEELRPREAAQVLDMTPARFSVRLYRAKQRLRKKLQLAGHDRIESIDAERGERTNATLGAGREIPNGDYS